MKDFISDKWRAILEFNHLADFDALWALDAEWFEPPNHRRGGWSGVARYEMSLPGGGKAAVFLKRQENHNTRSWRHPITGIPTFLREFSRIMEYRHCGVSTLEPVFFGVRAHGGDQRAILMTEEMAGFTSLSDLGHAWKSSGFPQRDVRKQIVVAVADLLRRMHDHHIRHGCFFTKHVFVRLSEGQAEAKVIDLEKSRRHPLRMACAVRDLYSLNHAPAQEWRVTDRLRFLLCYLGTERLSPGAKRLWRKVAAVSARKRRQRAGN